MENRHISCEKDLLKEISKLTETLAHQEEYIKNLIKLNKDYSLLFDKMLNGFAHHEIILDKEGKPFDYRFLEANTAFENLTGLKRSEIIGKTVLEVLPDLEPYWIETYGKVAMTGKPIHFEHYSQSLKKHYLVTAYSPKKKYFATIFSDITELKMLEEKTKRLSNLLTANKNINQLILRSDNEYKLYQKICDILREIEPIKFVWIGLAEEKNFDVKPVAYAGAEANFFSEVKIKYDESEFGNAPAGIAIKTGKPFVINNIKAYDKYLLWRDGALKRNFASVVSLPLIYENKVIGSMAVFSEKESAFSKEELAFLEEVANDITVGVKSIRLEENLKKSNKQLLKSIENTIFIMVKLSEVKDPYTAGHQRRVAQLATAIAKKMVLPEEKIESIRFASIIHDIGKVCIPGELLTKPAKFTETEFALIKEHPKICYDIIKDIDLPGKVADIILQHHERLDGSGYPNGIKDKEILLEAKIVAVADVVEAMSSHRPYRPALGIDKALEEISMNKGKLYDPSVAEACIKLFKEDGFKFE